MITLPGAKWLGEEQLDVQSYQPALHSIAVNSEPLSKRRCTETTRWVRLRPTRTARHLRVKSYEIPLLVIQPQIEVIRPVRF